MKSNGDFFSMHIRDGRRRENTRSERVKKKIFHLLILLLMLFQFCVLLCKRRQEHVECEEILINSITSNVGRARAAETSAENRKELLQEIRNFTFITLDLILNCANDNDSRGCKSIRDMDILR